LKPLRAGRQGLTPAPSDNREVRRSALRSQPGEKKMRCADFSIDTKVQGCALPPTAQVILEMSTSVQRA